MTATQRCHILLPSYHDVESFLVLRDRVLELDIEMAPQFWLVDDAAGRDPETVQLCDLDDVTVIGPPFNLGHQRAIVLGLRVAGPSFRDDDVVVTMDCDGEDRPEDLPALVAALAEDPDPWRVVIARRTHREESMVFKVLYFGFRAMFRTLTGAEVRSGNFACFRGRYVHDLLSHPSFDLCYSSSLLTLNPDPVPVPCPRGHRYAGRSRMGPEKLLSHGIRMLMPFADRIAIRSLALCAIASMLIAMGSVGLLVARAAGLVGAFPAWWGWALAAGVAVSALGFVNFLVLFAGHSQANALALARIEDSVTVT